MFLPGAGRHAAPNLGAPHSGLCPIGVASLESWEESHTFAEDIAGPDCSSLGLP